MKPPTWLTKRKSKKKPTETAQLLPASRNAVLSNDTIRTLRTMVHSHVPQLALAAVDAVL